MDFFIFRKKKNGHHWWNLSDTNGGISLRREEQKNTGFITIYNFHLMLVIIRGPHTVINYNNFTQKLNYWVPCTWDTFSGTLQFNCQI